MITRAISRAYRVMRERNWDTVYWAVDLHGTVLESTYQVGTFQFINQAAETALQYLSSLPETRIIVWSSMHDADMQGAVDFLRSRGISVHYANENPEVGNTATGNFDRKFYFSVVVDDKAGFDPSEWEDIALAVRLCREIEDHEAIN